MKWVLGKRRGGVLFARLIVYATMVKVIVAGDPEVVRVEPPGPVYVDERSDLTTAPFARLV